MTTIDFNSSAVQQRAQYAANVLRNKTDQLEHDERVLAELSRERISSSNALINAEKAQKKLGPNTTVDSKIEQIRAAIDSIRTREDVASRIVTAGKKLLDEFLAEGDPTNRELLAAAKNFADAEQEIARL